MVFRCFVADDCDFANIEESKVPQQSNIEVYNSCSARSLKRTRQDQLDQVIIQLFFFMLARVALCQV